MQDDQMIITLIRTGKSDKALNALYAHFPMMRKMIRQYGGDRQDAEDTFQEALILLCRRIRETDFTLTAKLSTYLYSVCRFLWKDELKKRNRQITLPGTVLTDSEEEDLYKAVERETDLKLAEKAITELGERCRELLLLFYQKGLNLREIASKMGYNSEKTAKNQKYKCLANAGNKLKELRQTAQLR